MGGADTDLIAGDLLVDFKVTRKGEVAARDLDQLLGYYLLSRNQRRLDPRFPKMERAAIYFCRYGYLWLQDVNVWVTHPEFARIEKWFFGRAKELLGPSRTRTEFEDCQQVDITSHSDSSFGCILTTFRRNGITRCAGVLHWIDGHRSYGRAEDAMQETGRNAKGFAGKRPAGVV